MEQAKQLLIAGKYLEALQIYKTFSQHNSIAALNAAICLINIKQLQEALLFTNQSIALDSSYTKAYYRKAQLLIQLEEYDEALDLIKQLQTKSPCKEVDNLREQIISQFCNPMYFLKEMKECEREKDALHLFAKLQSRQEYITYDLKEGQFCHELFQIKNDFLVYHRLRFIGSVLQLQEIEHLPQWLENHLINECQFYQTQHLYKEYEIREQFQLLFSRVKITTKVIELLLSNMDYHFDKYLLHTTKLFYNNPNYESDMKFPQILAHYCRSIDCHSEQFQLILEIIIIILNKKYLEFDFLKRDTFRKQDIILLMGQIPYLNEIKVDVAQILARTLSKKYKVIQMVDLCNQFLMLTLQNIEFQTKINTYSNEYIPLILDQLKQENNLKYLCLLFQLQSQGKYMQLYEYVCQANCEILIKQSFEEVDDGLIVLQFICKFDDVKKIIITHFKKEFLEFSKSIVIDKKAFRFKKMKQYQIFIAYLQVLAQLTLDVQLEYKEKQKQSYCIDNETYEMARQISKQYQQDTSDKYLTYNEQFILNNNVLSYIVQDIKIIQLLSQFIHLYEQVLDKHAKEIIVSLLNRLSIDPNMQPYLFDRQCLKIVAQDLLSGSIVGVPLMSVLLRNVNPQQFDFKEAQLLSDALIKCAQIATHELHIFHSLLGLVQLTSLGEYVCDRIIVRKDLLIFQNLLLEQNHYIVHAALQIINNLAALSDKFLEYNDMQKSQLMTILILLTQQYYEMSQSEQKQNVSDFSHPLQILKTLFNVLILTQQFDRIKKEMIKIIRDEELIKKMNQLDEKMKEKIEFLWSSCGWKRV